MIVSMVLKAARHMPGFPEIDDELEDQDDMAESHAKGVVEAPGAWENLEGHNVT